MHVMVEKRLKGARETGCEEMGHAIHARLSDGEDVLSRDAAPGQEDALYAALRPRSADRLGWPVAALIILLLSVVMWWVLSGVGAWLVR